jgi:hypothetical protein
MNPEHPVYIPSKGRWQSRLTIRALDRMAVPYKVIVEEQERDAYASVVDSAKILVLDPAYQRDYDACCRLEPGRSKGSGPARNFAWDHAAAAGAPWHWVVDDNIKCFYRFNHNLKVPVTDGTMFKCMEDFADRYANVAMAGPHYFMFASRKAKPRSPFTLNTRIYSCNLIRIASPFRWRARYNEDTDLSLRMLKAGWCTVLFNAFLQEKMVTLTMRGGNTDELYKDGTLAKSRMLADLHPDCVKVTRKFNRWHHHADYARFKQPLVRRPDLELPDGRDEYGMRLVKVA